MQFLSDVGERGAGARVRARHASVADRRQEHGAHADQNRGDDVAAGFLADDAVNAHRRNRLDQDDAVEDQIPQRERPPEVRRGVSRCELSGHRPPPETRERSIPQRGLP
jgi:hypothetical protein